MPKTRASTATTSSTVGPGMPLKSLVRTWAITAPMKQHHAQQDQHMRNRSRYRTAPQPVVGSGLFGWQGLPVLPVRHGLSLFAVGAPSYVGTTTPI